MDDDLQQSMEAIGGLRVVTVTNKDPSSPEEKQTFQRSPGLTMAEGERIGNESPFVEAFLPQRDLWRNHLSVRGQHVHAHVRAVGPKHLEVYNYKIRQGRPLSWEDHMKKQFVCVIGRQVAERLFGKGVDPVGQELNIDRYRFTIVGLIQTETIFQQQSNEVLFPFSLYASKFASRFSRQNELAFLLKDVKAADAAQRDLRNRFLALHRGVEDFSVEINQDKIKEMKTAGLGMKVLLASIAIISLLVGGISIMNIMFATIEDRIREIGIRKALGARKRDIFAQFVIEAILLSGVGGLPGMLLGTAVTLVPEGVFPYNPRLGEPDYILAITFTVFIGFVAGMFPSMRAANMQPVDALRY
jgi:putative ABC transport system permease protein